MRSSCDVEVPFEDHVKRLNYAHIPDCCPLDVISPLFLTLFWPFSFPTFLTSALFSCLRPSLTSPVTCFVSALLPIHPNSFDYFIFSSFSSPSFPLFLLNPSATHYSPHFLVSIFHSLRVIKGSHTTRDSN